MDTNQYLEVFIDESNEHLQSCSESLLLLEQNPEDLAIVNDIFRNAHTLKGMSATMGFEDIANLTHKMENVLDAIRNNQLAVSSDLLDVVFESVDHLEEMVLDISSGGDGKKDVTATVEKLKKLENGEPIGEAEVAVTPAESTSTATSKLVFDDFEKTVLEQSVEQGFQSYEINISLRDDCLLKAARVYMVFEILEKLGEVIKSSPTVEKLEEEQFDTDFSVAFVTQEPANDLMQKLMKVSEVELVNVQPISISKVSVEAVVEQEEVVEATPAPAPAPKKVVETKAPQKNNAHNASKTIRVNIDRLDILMNLFEELVIDRGRLQSISSELNHNELNDTVERMTRVSGDLQNIIL
ncbi:MAG: Hpt domain-containing protein, partial [Kurthia sp.]